jgi:hypothetical protein
MNIISRFVRDESGATAIEYGLIAALIAVVSHRRCCDYRCDRRRHQTVVDLQQPVDQG